MNETFILFQGATSLLDAYCLSAGVDISIFHHHFIVTHFKVLMKKVHAETAKGIITLQDILNFGKYGQISSIHWSDFRYIWEMQHHKPRFCGIVQVLGKARSPYIA